MADEQDSVDRATLDALAQTVWRATTRTTISKNDAVKIARAVLGWHTTVVGKVQYVGTHLGRRDELITHLIPRMQAHVVETALATGLIPVEIPQVTQEFVQAVGFASDGPLWRPVFSAEAATDIKLSVTMKCRPAWHS